MVSESNPLSVSGLRKAYRGRRVLDSVALEVRRGEAVGVLGPNGSGKSTFLGCITGDRLPDAGEVRLCGADPFSDLSAAARCMGFVPEQPYLYGDLTVSEMLQFVAAARGLDPAAAGSESDRLRSLLGLDGAETLLCRELSQGMGRKVAVIAALLHEPRLIILDEAFNGLDQGSVDRLRSELDGRRERGAAILLSSHDLRFVAGWCTRALLLAPEARWRLLEGSDWEVWRGNPSLDAFGNPAPGSRENE
jgi:ABC-2 type transport system ATP-binding protein